MQSHDCSQESARICPQQRLKEFWFDCETTGKDPKVHEIVQIAGEFCGEEFNFLCQPTNWSVVEPDALTVQGRTLDDLRTYQEPQVAFQGLVDLLNRHIDRYGKTDRADMCAFNAKFDTDFLYAFFSKYSPWDGPKYRKYNVGNYFIKVPFCVMNAYRFAVKLGKLPPPTDYKLATLCSVHGISLKAHDALEDAKATKKLFDVVKGRF